MAVDKNCVDGNCFAINDKSHGSGDTTLNIVYKPNYTNQICTARFRVKSKDGSIQKEYMIVQDAKKVYYNIRMVQPFTKDDCMANQHGSIVLYVVEERTYSSTISQEDADARAMEDIALHGQDYANSHGECITDMWYNVEQRQKFIRNNCDEFSNGKEYIYIVPAGKYVSSISQEDADRKALEEIEQNGQSTANINGECEPKSNIFHGKYSMTFTRNNCDSTQYGTDVVVDETMVAGDFRSIISQEDANQKAKNAVEAQGQDIANIKGNCEKIPVYTGAYSKIFKRDNCPAGSKAIPFTVDEKMCSGYPFTSTVSQDDANSKAQTAVEEQGQAIANERGGCDTSLFYNKQLSKEFTRNNCDEFSDGQTYTYVVPEGKYSSNVSQADADAKAQAEIDEKGQSTANIEGECRPKENIYYGVYSKGFTRNNCDETQYGTEVVVDETMVTGDFRSAVSQEDANNKAKAAVEAQGQDIANIKGSCEKYPVYTGVYSKEFTRTNCPEGGVPGTYVVSERMVAGHPFTSIVSQDDANNKAKTAVEAQGQAVANENAKCTFTGHASLAFTRDNCEVGYMGSVVTVTEEDVTGGPFLSTESQAAADMVALLAVQKQGQEIANANGTCIEKPYFVGVASFEFTRNNCGANKVGVPFIVTQDMVEGHPFISYSSQEEANLVALAAVMDQGQGVANERGECKEASKYTGHYSKVFEKNNCPAGLIPSSVTINEGDVTGGPFYSYESQYAADELAKAAVEAQGQEIANSRGTCDEMKIYIGNYSKDITPECPDCQYADPITVTPDLMGQFFTSTRSQEEADALAKAYIDRMGQAFVNKNYDNTCHTIVEQPRWETIEEVCKDCISQLHQRNVNTCYTGSEQERHIPGGSKTCYWFGIYSKEFTKQCAGSGVGSKVTVTQNDVTDPNPSAEGKFKSCVSQTDANNKAKAAVEAQGQSVANAKGTCTWTGHWSGPVQRNDCADGGVGDTVTVDSNNLSGYPDEYKSNISQADADAKAQAAVKGEKGQAYANKNGGCTWTYVATRRFYKNDCAGSGVGQPIDVTSTQANGGTAITSKISLADAKSKAEQILDQKGQDYANSHGTCVWTGTGSATFYRNNCGSCMHGTAISVPYSALGQPDITSTVSQADANQKVQQALSSNSTVRAAAQAFANKNGNCASDDTTPSYGSWSYYCSGCTYRRTRPQTNPCSSASDQDEVVEYDSRSCGCGCDENNWTRVGSAVCNSCTSEALYRNDCGREEYRPYGNACYGSGGWSRVGGASCRSGSSQALYRDGCGNEEYRSYGSACCNTNSYSGGTAYKSGCTCPGAGVSYSGVSAGSICRSTTSQANSDATSQYNSNKSAAEAAAKCGTNVCNDAQTSTKTKTGCAANCTAPKATRTVAAGTYCECGGNKATLNSRAKSDADSQAQAAANAMACDCPEVTNGTMRVTIKVSPADPPNREGAMFKGSVRFEHVDNNTSYTIDFENLKHNGIAQKSLPTGTYNCYLNKTQYFKCSGSSNYIAVLSSYVTPQRVTLTSSGASIELQLESGCI